MAEESRALAPFTVLKTQLEERADQYAAALPSTIKPERFTRTVLTAVTQNPQLLECHRGSLLLACMKAAQDGLVPDGREAALVIFRETERLLSILGLEHPVAGSQQDVPREGSHLRFVVYHQDGLHLRPYSTSVALTLTVGRSGPRVSPCESGSVP